MDGKKLGEANEHLKEERKSVEAAGGDPKTAINNLAPADQTLINASITGDRKTLKTDALLPSIMAAIYLLLLLYFKTIGGYKPVQISPEKAAGGVQGPADY